MLQKLIYLSILIASIAIPMRAARMRSPVRALRRTVLATFLFHLLYLVAVLYVAPRL